MLSEGLQCSRDEDLKKLDRVLALMECKLGWRGCPVKTDKKTYQVISQPHRPKEHKPGRNDRTYQLGWRAS